MKKLPLINGGFALVSDGDYWLVGSLKWHKNHKNYVYCTSNVHGKRKSLHSFILEPVEGYEIDHINGDPLDNREENLRYATHAQNCLNQKTTKNSISGIKGIVWQKKDRLWVAHITKNGKSHYLGCSKDKLQAVKIYNERAPKIGGEFTRLNTVP